MPLKLPSKSHASLLNFPNTAETVLGLFISSFFIIYSFADLDAYLPNGLTSVAATLLSIKSFALMILNFRVILTSPILEG